MPRCERRGACPEAIPVWLQEQHALERSIARKRVDLRAQPEETRCVCGDPADYGGLMVMCERCRSWFHDTCVGVVEATLPSEWYCAPCRAGVADEELSPPQPHPQPLPQPSPEEGPPPGMLYDPKGTEPRGLSLREAAFLALCRSPTALTAKAIVEVAASRRWLTPLRAGNVVAPPPERARLAEQPPTSLPAEISGGASSSSSSSSGTTAAKAHENSP
eukprot:RCo023667